jgi:hypothetical protein
MYKPELDTDKYCNIARQLAVLLVLLICVVLISVPPVSAQTSPGGEETDQLVYMREEEKLARDVYQVLGQSSQLPIFANIAESEQRHMDAVLAMLNMLGIADPVGENPPGVFSDSTLQSLYDQLIAQGAAGSLEALEVAIFIESTDISDLQNAIDTTTSTALARLYSNLLRGSQNHLSAFSNNLTALGGMSSGGQGNTPLDPGTAVYEPISQTLYIPAVDIADDSGQIIVYDILFRLVETLPVTFELVAINETVKTSSAIHSNYNSNTSILTLPRLIVGALAIDSLSDIEYSATFSLVQNVFGQILFSLSDITQIN